MECGGLTPLSYGEARLARQGAAPLAAPSSPSCSRAATLKSAGSPAIARHSEAGFAEESLFALRFAHFLPQPLGNHGHECRCNMRDPHGYIIEVGQFTQAAINALKNFAG